MSSAGVLLAVMVCDVAADTNQTNTFDVHLPVRFDSEKGRHISPNKTDTFYRFWAGAWDVSVTWTQMGGQNNKCVNASTGKFTVWKLTKHKNGCPHSNDTQIEVWEKIPPTNA